MVVKAFMSPPTASTASAISRALRCGVPLKSRCSRKCEAPAMVSGSSTEPVPTQNPRLTERTSGMCSVTTVRPPSTTVVSTTSRSLSTRSGSGYVPLAWPALSAGGGGCAAGPLATRRRRLAAPGPPAPAGGSGPLGPRSPKVDRASCLPGVLERHRLVVAGRRPFAVRSLAGVAVGGRCGAAGRPPAAGLAAPRATAKPCPAGRCRRRGPRPRRPGRGRPRPARPACPGTA